MALDKSTVILPGHGSVLLAPADTAPFDLDDFVLTGTVPDGWAITHTSRENPPKFSKDGGDATQLGSWEVDALASSREATTVAVEFSKIQLDKSNFEAAFGAGGNKWDELTKSFSVKNFGSSEHAVFIVMTDGAHNAGVYMPRVDLAIGDLPEIDPENFFEIAMSGQVLSSSTTGERMRWYAPRVITPTA